MGCFSRRFLLWLGWDITWMIFRKIPGILADFLAQSVSPQRAALSRAQPHFHSAAAAAVQTLQPDGFSTGDPFSCHHTSVGLSPTAEEKDYFLGFWLLVFISRKTNY